LLPRQNQFPSQLPSHHHNCFPDNSPAWLWPLRNWTKLPNQRAKKGSGSFKIPNNSCKLAQAGFASGSQNVANKWRNLDNSCGDAPSTSFANCLQVAVSFPKPTLRTASGVQVFHFPLPVGLRLLKSWPGS
jgi:hypothetical protein